MDLSTSPVAANPASAGLIKKSFPLACKEFFGLRPGTGFKEFADELKALTDADKAELKMLFRNVGYDIITA